MTDAAKGHYRKATGDPMTTENNRYQRCVEQTPKGLRCDKDAGHTDDHLWWTFAWPNLAHPGAAHNEACDLSNDHEGACHV